MLYSPDRGVLFLEVPKTGTVAVATAVRGVCRQYRALPRHVTAHKARRELGPQRWSELDTIAVVREPLGWLRSWYRYLSGVGRVADHINFSQFVVAVANDEPLEGVNLGVGTQFARLSDGKERRVIVKRLLSFEHLSAEFNAVNAELLDGTAKDLARKNVSPRKDVVVPDDLRELIETRWAKDREIWAEVHELAEQTHSTAPTAP